MSVAATGAAVSGGASSAPAATTTGTVVQASALTGSSSVVVSAALQRRGPSVSRDSARQTLEAASQEQLGAAAEAQAKQRNAALAKLAASAEKHAATIARNAWQLPISPGVYRLTGRFGQCSYLWAHCHTGLDFAAPSGTPVRSIANGVVTETGSAGAYGNRVIVTLEDGTELWYCHLSGYAVGVGDLVVGGRILGYVGSTGNSTGPHLHVEVRPGAGDPVDPYTALAVHGDAP